VGARGKFTDRARTRVLEVVRAGGSRREAARAAGISHTSLARWIERGKTAADGTTVREFYLRLREAEGAPAELVALETEFERSIADADSALEWLQDLEQPITFRVVMPPPLPGGRGD
jgi:molybdenum-dependent DNA-binding transcriptional regulator ModE